MTRRSRDRETRRRDRETRCRDRKSDAAIGDRASGALDGLKEDFPERLAVKRARCPVLKDLQV